MMFSVRQILASLLLLCSTSLSFASGARAVEVVRPASPVVTYEVSEWQVDLPKAYGNPFDPNEVAVDATFKGPGGVIAMPAFWYQGVDQDISRSDAQSAKLVGSGRWVVRFAPTAPGDWTVSVKVTDALGTLTSDTVRFRAGKPMTNGFVHASPANHRYFQFDSGKSYFVVGLNLAYTRPWANGANRGNQANYPQWLAKLSANGGNFARIWTSHLKTGNSATNRYDPIEGDRLDRVLRLAQHDGVYCMLTLDNYRQFFDKDEWGPGLWSVNPYNKANGGPAATAPEAFTNEEARKLYKQRLRYMVARYSAFSSLAFWELLNEGDNLKYLIKYEIPVGWYREMSRELVSDDPYHRLVSTSFGSPPGVDTEPTWRAPSIGVVQAHIYGDGTRQADCSNTIVGDAMAHRVYDKPYLVAEAGISYRGPDNAYDKSNLGTNLHNALWAAALSGAAGGACYWYWDNYVDMADQWAAYRGLANFAATVDWAHRRFQPVALPPQPEPKLDVPRRVDDLVLFGEAPWGRAEMAPIRIDSTGHYLGRVPQYMFGPEKPDFQRPMTFEVNAINNGTMTIAVDRISDHATLRATLDGKPVGDFAFSAQPGSPGLVETAYKPDWKVYQANVEDRFVVDLSQGKHVIVVDVISGDWARIDSITFSGGQFSYQGVRRQTVALSDPASGDTLAWIRNSSSTWRADVDDKQPEPIKNLPLVLAASQPGSYSVEWWDTRTGTLVRTVKVAARGGLLTLTAPDFDRDIAVKAVHN